MIYLTRLNNQPIYVNSDLIKYIESTPDTKVTFINGDVLIVKEKVQEVVDKIFQYKQNFSIKVKE